MDLGRLPIVIQSPKFRGCSSVARVHQCRDAGAGIWRLCVAVACRLRVLRCAQPSFGEEDTARRSDFGTGGILSD